MAGKKVKFPVEDHVCGVERNPSSDLYGRVVVGAHGTLPIVLWRRPGCELSAENVTGALAHNHKVTVTRRIMYKERPYYYVNADVRHDGKTYPQRGWLIGDLLRELGGSN